MLSAGGTIAEALALVMRGSTGMLSAGGTIAEALALVMRGSTGTPLPIGATRAAVALFVVLAGCEVAAASTGCGFFILVQGLHLAQVASSSGNPSQRTEVSAESFLPSAAAAAAAAAAFTACDVTDFVQIGGASFSRSATSAVGLASSATILALGASPSIHRMWWMSAGLLSNAGDVSMAPAN
jgi:hypothetical protein